MIRSACAPRKRLMFHQRTSRRCTRSACWTSWDLRRSVLCVFLQKICRLFRQPLEEVIFQLKYPLEVLFPLLVSALVDRVQSRLGKVFPLIIIALFCSEWRVTKRFAHKFVLPLANLRKVNYQVFSQLSRGIFLCTAHLQTCMHCPLWLCRVIHSLRIFIKLFYLPHLGYVIH